MPLGVSWVSPGCVLGVSWVSLGCFLGASWVLLGVLGAPGCLLGAPWVLLGAPGWTLDLPIKSSSPNQISFEKILLGVSWWGHIKFVFENMCLLILDGYTILAQALCFQELPHPPTQRVGAMAHHSKKGLERYSRQVSSTMNQKTCSWKHAHKRFVSIGAPMAGKQKPQAHLAEGMVMKT